MWGAWGPAVVGQCISGGTSAADSHATHKVPYDAAAFLAGEGVQSSTGLGGPDACIDSIAGSMYFNQPDVIAAIHVKAQPIPWSTCGNQINYTSTRKNLPRDTYPSLVKRLRVLVYNGDSGSREHICLFALSPCIMHALLPPIPDPEDGDAWVGLD